MPVGIFRSPSEPNCSDTAAIQVQAYREEAFYLVILGFIPLGILYSIKGIFVYVFPKHNEKESDDKE